MPPTPLPAELSELDLLDMLGLSHTAQFISYDELKRRVSQLVLRLHADKGIDQDTLPFRYERFVGLKRWLSDNTGVPGEEVVRAVYINRQAYKHTSIWNPFGAKTSTDNAIGGAVFYRSNGFFCPIPGAPTTPRPFRAAPRPSAAASTPAPRPSCPPPTPSTPGRPARPRAPDSEPVFMGERRAGGRYSFQPTNNREEVRRPSWMGNMPGAAGSGEGNASGTAGSGRCSISGLCSHC